ncbi:hypothetical protein DM01DRAFT_1339355 [Hesseltinella vesiculosa]|uniref:Transcription factor domain-containing protein n=1 Tax=Hesseltinella vesiculosa TaxID=101127 RepID=A0A1X2G7J8_9FUNG|nr:hypothetical protein DM01DRAFT_1339355 [Hesseltinella vesiculosa]
MYQPQANGTSEIVRPVLPVPLDVSFLPIQKEEDWTLPEGWVMKERKRSLVEVETNIRTLGQLYRTLSDMKKQLPSPVVADAEQPATPPFLAKKRNSSMGWLPVTPVSKRSFSKLGGGNPRVWHDHPSLAPYPYELFDRLVRLHLSCTSSSPTWRDPAQFLQMFHQGTLHRGLLYALCAYSALHGVMCHPDSFPPSTLPTLLPLAQDCYTLACEAVEFDDISTSNVEALVLLHLYANLVMQHEDHFLWVAKRQIQYLDYTKWWNFRAWFQRIKFATNASGPEDGTPTMTKPQQAPSNAHLQSPELMARYSSASYDHPHYLQRLWVYYEIRGWALLRDEATSIGQLDAWFQDSTKAMQVEQATLPLWQQLRLQVLYLSGLLHWYQRELILALAENDRAQEQSSADYFTFSSNARDRLEQVLNNGIMIAFQLIQSVFRLFSIHHRCILPELIDTLTSACTLLYFGEKMSSDTQMALQAQQSLRQLVVAFQAEQGMLQSHKVFQAVCRWQSMLQPTT